MSVQNTWWPWIQVASITRPSRTLPESKKDQAYDVACARWYLSQQLRGNVDHFRMEYATNTAFYQGMWGTAEDRETFLADQGISNSRVELTLPVMQPVVTRIEGSALNVNIDAHSESATAIRAKRRKDDEKNKVLSLSLAAQQGPFVQNAVTANTGITGNEAEDIDFFERTYQDKLEMGSTMLMEALAEENGLHRLKGVAARKAFLSGIWAGHTYIHGTKLRFEMIDPMDFGFDHNAKQQDGTDGEYMYICPLMPLSTIGERWHAGEETIEELDQWLRLRGGAGVNFGWPEGMPRVQTVYWKDLKYVTRGWVVKDGHPHLCTLNEKEEGEEKVYTEADCVEAPAEFAELQPIWKGKKYMKCCMEYVRHCSFIPWEYLPGAKDTKFTPGKTPDVVFDSGVYPLQEEDPDDYFSVRFPIKMRCWSYLFGKVLAPATCIQSPQRVMDMVFTDLMWRLSKSGIGMPIFDMKAVANSKQKMAEVISNWKEGIPTQIDSTVTGGMANAFGVAPGNLDAGFYNAWSILPQLKGIAEDATGIHADAMGENNDPKKLVGTTEIAIQQTNIMLRPFMDSQVDWFLSINQCFAQAGIQFYRTMPWALDELVGDEAAAAIMEMGESTLERFRVKQVVTYEAEAMKEKADQMALAYLQMGLLDPESAAQCLGNSFPRDVDNAVRAYTKRAAKAAQQQQADMAKQQQMGMLMQQQQNLDAQQQQASAGLAQTAMEAEKINQKAQDPLVQAAAQHLAPQEQPEPQM